MPQVGSFGPQDPPWRSCLRLLKLRVATVAVTAGLGRPARICSGQAARGRPSGGAETICLREHSHTSLGGWTMARSSA